MKSLSRKRLYLGCTMARHVRIGIDAVVNARAELQSLNDQTQEEIELTRDASKIQAWRESRVRFYQFNSKFCRRHLHRLSHLLSRYDD